MRLSELLDGYECKDFCDCEVTGLSSDSHSSSGCLFFALKGSKLDGEDYGLEATKRGAVGVVSEKPLDITNNFVVKNVRETMYKLASRFWSNPFKKVKLIGVTGTNGKTTTTHIIADILNSAGKNTGIIGTLGAKWNDKTIPLKNTTPGFLEFCEIVANMSRDYVNFVVCEVSAHAIEQKRLGNVPFLIKVFTNLTQDHLDYFGDMESYRRTKLEFFKTGANCFNVVNGDTELGREIARKMDKNTLTYGLHSPADVFGIDLCVNNSHTSFIANVLDEIYDIKTGLTGEFNAYNLLAGITVCSMLGVKGRALKQGVEKIKPVKGRFNVYKGNKTAIIDYAHTPDGLKNVLIESRKMTCGKLICVFGCGGDRDRSKRPIMGKIAEDYADLVVLTEDNSRNESTLDIIREIASEMVSEPKVIPDRRRATEYALFIAEEDDVVVIAGKGGEDYIEREYKISYSDETEVKRILGIVT